MKLQGSALRMTIFIGEDDIPLKLLPGGVNHEFTASLVGLADYFELVYRHHFQAPENSFTRRVQRVYELFQRHEDRLANRDAVAHYSAALALRKASIRT